MKKRIAIAVLFVAASLAAADVSGTWNGKGMLQDAKYGGIPQSAQLTLIQAGSTVQGTIKVNNANPIPISAGAVSGTQVTFTFRLGSGQVTASLSVVGGQLQGRMTSSSGRVFTVAFTHQ